jgi:hypothetical protein
LAGHYFNLNSLNKAGPMLITEFYLSAYMQQLRTEGYSIFVVRGNPTSHPQPFNPARARVQAVTDVLARYVSFHHSPSLALSHGFTASLHVTSPHLTSPHLTSAYVISYNVVIISPLFLCVLPNPHHSKGQDVVKGGGSGGAGAGAGAGATPKKKTREQEELERAMRESAQLAQAQGVPSSMRAVCLPLSLSFDRSINLLYVCCVLCGR